MKNYLDGLQYILDNGTYKTDRTGTGTISTFGSQLRFDLSNNQLPLVTTKELHLKSIIHELIWMISGDTNVRYLIANGVRIWNEWVKSTTAEYEKLDAASIKDAISKFPKYRILELLAIKDLDPIDAKMDMDEYLYIGLYNREPVRLIAGELGPVYGKNWRDIDDIREVVSHNDRLELPRGFSKADCTTYIDKDTGEEKVFCKRKIDQFEDLLDGLLHNPFSRRHILNAWHVPYLDEMALPPCHAFVQFYVNENKLTGRKEISCQLYQRSADEFLGKPFNIAFYSIMTHAIANQLDMDAKEFIWTGGDCHIYSNHIEQVKLQLSRTPKGMARIDFKEKGKSILEMTYDDIEITNYNPDPKIPAKVAV